MSSEQHWDEVLERIKARESDPAHQAQEAEKRASEQRQVRARKEAAIEKTGMPARIREIVGGALKTTEATEALATTGDGLIVLSGDPGCGKTVAAAAWLRDLIFAEGRVTAFQGYQGRQPLFVTAARLSRWDRYDRDAMDTLLKADRLVLDDLGSEYADVKGNFLAIVDELVSERHGNRMPLVMTTNLAAVEFKERYDERIADRIREVGCFVSLDGESMRKRHDGGKAA